MKEDRYGTESSEHRPIKIYVCKKCGFMFTRVSAVTQCPSCDGEEIASATRQEEERFLELLYKTE